MIDVLRLLRSVLASLFKSRARLELEILVLRQQINVLRRQEPKRLRLTNLDRLAFVWLYRLWPAVIDAVTLLRPETLLGWHRKGFRAYWRWKSRSTGGRPRVRRDIRDLIREISLANPFWGAPRIHGELLKLGLDVAQTTVTKYMARHRRVPTENLIWDGVVRASVIGSINSLFTPVSSLGLIDNFELWISRVALHGIPPTNPLVSSFLIKASLTPT